jgi:glycerol kinase
MKQKSLSSGHRPGHDLDPRHPVRRRGNRPVASHAIELRQIYPANGWVEHDAEEIWQATLACCRAVLKGVPADDISPPSASPTSARPRVIWDAQDRPPLHNAIVWQDRRTADAAAALKAGLLSPRSRPRPGCCSIPISPPPSWNGC